MTTDATKAWQAIEIPPEVARVPAMLSDEERRYLIWTTAVAYQGKGAVVDLGPWLGGSSTALAEGLRRRGLPGPVHCRDLFAWSRSYMPGCHDVDLAEGADFQPLFEQHTAAYRELLDTRQMDLLRAAWDGGPIELLFVDAAKSWELLNAILRVFGPHLVPGLSRIVHQDFRHVPGYFIPLVVDSRNDLWEEIEAVDVGDTVSFRLRREWDPSGLPYDEDSFPFDVARRLAGHRIATARPVHRRAHQLGLLVKAIVEGEHAAADELRASIRREAGATGIDDAIARAEDRAIQALTRLATREIERVGPAAEATIVAQWAMRLPARADVAAFREQLRLATAALLLERAAAELARRDFDSANDETMAALARLGPGDTKVRDALSLLEQAWTAEQDGARAERALAALAPRYDSVGDFHVLTALVALHRTGKDAARTALRRALAIDPGHADAQRLLAELA